MGLIKIIGGRAVYDLMLWLLAGRIEIIAVWIASGFSNLSNCFDLDAINHDL